MNAHTVCGGMNSVRADDGGASVLGSHSIIALGTHERGKESDAFQSTFALPSEAEEIHELAPCWIGLIGLD